MDHQRYLSFQSLSGRLRRLFWCEREDAGSDAVAASILTLTP
jgi:hypothetical protein